MAERDSNLDPQNAHNNFNEIAKNEESMRSWSCSRYDVTDSSQPIGDLIVQGQVLDITFQKKVSRFCMVAICDPNLQLKVLFQPLGGYNNHNYIVIILVQTLNKLYPSKHAKLVQCWFNVGPPRWPIIKPTLR